MELLIYDTYEQMSAAAGQIYLRQLQQNPHSVLGFATGSTPLGLYRFLIEQNKLGTIDFSHVVTFNLDEYYPMQPTHPQSYRYFMDENLFNHINIAKESTFVPEDDASHPDTICLNYEEDIRNMGGIDLQLLGVGRNGHIGFNEPADTLTADTHVTNLTESTLHANARFFETKEDVPTQAITMGMATILKAKQIVCLISGADKHDVVRQLLGQGISTRCPATFLKLHPHVIVLCDRKAYEGK